VVRGHAGGPHRAARGRARAGVAQRTGAPSLTIVALPPIRNAAPLWRCCPTISPQIARRRRGARPRIFAGGPQNAQADEVARGERLLTIEGRSQLAVVAAL